MIHTFEWEVVIHVEVILIEPVKTKNHKLDEHKKDNSYLDELQSLPHLSVSLSNLL